MIEFRTVWTFADFRRTEFLTKQVIPVMDVNADGLDGFDFAPAGEGMKGPKMNLVGKHDIININTRPYPRPPETRTNTPDIFSTV